MNNQKEHRWDQLLDLLAEEVAERLRAADVPPSDVPSDRDAAQEEQATRPPKTVTASEPAAPTAAPDAASAGENEIESDASDPDVALAGTSAPPIPSHTARLLGRLALGLLAVLIVINVPINRHGTTLATAMPDRRALVIRDGLVVKEEDEPEIYVLEDGQFRWISSLRAFEMRGYTWEDVHIVEDGFLEPFEIGPPIHVILKCRESPHIYRLEGEEKRWIVDIEAFEEEGHVWDDVKFVSCSYLRDLPDGETIPAGHGPPPQP